MPPEQLLRSFGGDAEFVYDHAVYWPAMLELAAGRRAAAYDRWVSRGSRVGESEGFLKGGEDSGVGAFGEGGGGSGV